MSFDVVVFAGAGASAAGGYAQTGEILPEVLRRLKRRSFEHRELKGREDALLQRAHAILPGLASDEFEGVELADLVSILDHCISEGEALGPELEAADLLTMRRLLDLAMAEVLGRPLPNRAVTADSRSFARALMSHSTAGRRLAVVSPNYDVSLDLALFRALESRGIDPRASVDFGFTRRDERSGELVPPPARPSLGLFKLHGSLNWLLCERCDCVTVDFEERSAGSQRRACACGHGPMQMLLVAPSLVRDVRDVNLRGTWQSAQEALRTATLWIFIGFALRGEDLAIRSVLARARLASEGVARRIVVVGKGDEPPAGIGLFLGDFEYVAGGLEGWLAKEQA